MKVAGKVEQDALLARARSANRYYVDPRRGGRPQAPERSGAAVAEQGPRPACKHCCHATSVSGQPTVTDSVDTEIHSMKPTGSYSPLDCAASEAQSRELPVGDHTMLTLGQPCDHSVMWSI